MDFENSAKKFAPILKDFLESYVEKDAGVSNKEWLKNQLKKQALDFAKEKLETYSEELAGGVESYDATLQSIRSAKAAGKNAEEWLAENVADAPRQASTEEIAAAADALGKSGEVLFRNMRAEELHVDAMKSAEEYTAEQTCIDDFNSAEGNDRYVAGVDDVNDGSVYGRNQFDITVRDKFTGQKLENYLVKYGSTALETIEMVSKLTNAGEKVLVPAEQLDEVQKALPGWKIVSALGGTPLVKVASSPLTKDLIEKCLNGELLDKAKKVLNKEPSELVKEVATSAMTSGVISAGFLGGLEKLANGEPIENIKGREVIEQALLSGDTQGLKMAASGALATFVQKGMTKLIPKSTPACVISGIASAGVESVSIMSKVANGTLTATQAVEEFANTKLAGVFESVWGKFAKKATVVALNYIPVVGPYLSTLVASGTLDAVGGVIKQKVKQVVQEKVVPVVKTVAKKVYSAAKSVVSTCWNAAKSVVKRLFSWW